MTLTRTSAIKSKDSRSYMVIWYSDFSPYYKGHISFDDSTTG